MTESITRSYTVICGFPLLTFERFPYVVIENAEHGWRIIVLVHADTQSLERYIGLGTWVLMSVVLDKSLDELLLLEHIQLVPLLIREARLFTEAVRRGRRGRVYRA